jgi:hypothetical protein
MIPPTTSAITWTSRLRQNEADIDTTNVPLAAASSSEPKQAVVLQL